MALYFSDDEVRGLAARLVAMLNHARERAGVPFVITSGLRSEEENDAAGGVGNSSHVKGLGVDVACSGSRERYLMVTGLLDAGFTRIGLYDRHVHADCDLSLPPQVMWTGKSK